MHERLYELVAHPGRHVALVIHGEHESHTGAVVLELPCGGLEGDALRSLATFMGHVAKRRIGMLDRESSIGIESSWEAIGRESRAENPPEDQIFACNLASFRGLPSRRRRAHQFLVRARRGVRAQRPLTRATPRIVASCRS